MKLEGVRSAQKEGWMEEVDKLSGSVERDQLTIQSLLNRRIFIRHSYVLDLLSVSPSYPFTCRLWHELRVVLHNRENTLMTQAVRSFAHEESSFAEASSATWNALAEAVEDMPYE